MEGAVPNEMLVEVRIAFNTSLNRQWFDIVKESSFVVVNVRL